VRYRAYGFALALALAALSPSGAQAAQAPRNRAVLIGINDYSRRIGKLKYCVADAKAVRDQLVRGAVFGAGDILLMTDDAERANQPTLANIETMLENLPTHAGGADTLLVFFAGHGETGGEGEDKKGLLIPIDGSPTKGIDLAAVRAWLAECKAKNTLLILDCCHAGEGERAVHTITADLAAGAGVVVLASCRGDEQSYDLPDQGHGVFSLFLANGLAGKADADDDREVTVDELHAYVRAGVSGWAFRKNVQQTPVRLPEAGGGGVVLARLRPDITPEVTLEPLPEVPALPELPEVEGTLDERAKVLEACEQALAEAKQHYTPTSQRVRTAEANLRKAREGVRQALLTELAPRLKALRERYAQMSREMRPTHPKMKEAAGRIRTGTDRVLALARVLKREDFEELELSLTFTDWPFDAAEAGRRQELTAAALGVPVEKTVDLGRGVKMEFVLIPAGEFLMGSPGTEDKHENDEGPQHRVRITKPFYMAKTEVTQEQWQAVRGEDPSHFKGAKNPVEQASWNDCQEFAKKLGARFDGLTFALPTEAEWEYACRAGTSTPFHTGETISTEQANYDGDYTYGRGRKGVDRDKTVRVGSFRANAFGLYDMHGNVWELCRDRYGKDYYKQSPKDDPQGPGRGEARVVRGGSWNFGPRNCRSAYRGRNFPSSRNYFNGCRLVLRDF